ncbi:MAG: LysM peptidoglycan-binding domain-containing protein [Verrucomicrobiaceae bacterium]|nr:LysM peptidoglycan-binding domain-containing protein [Verrucomicrobiaceae bacterium]
MIKRLILAFIILGLAACTSTQTKKIHAGSYGWASLDSQLPDGSAATPPHKLPSHEYPFSDTGQYMPSWAVAGEKRHGRTTYTGPKSTSSHGSDSNKIGYRRHKIVTGDTLYGIARRYGTSVNAIKRANNLRSDLIIRGRTLKIP